MAAKGGPGEAIVENPDDLGLAGHHHHHNPCSLGHPARERERERETERDVPYSTERPRPHTHTHSWCCCVLGPLSGCGGGGDSVLNPPCTIYASGPKEGEERRVCCSWSCRCCYCCCSNRMSHLLLLLCLSSSNSCCCFCPPPPLDPPSFTVKAFLIEVVALRRNQPLCCGTHAPFAPMLYCCTLFVLSFKQHVDVTARLLLLRPRERES